MERVERSGDRTQSGVDTQGPNDAKKAHCTDKQTSFESDQSGLEVQD